MRLVEQFEWDFRPNSIKSGIFRHNLRLHYFFITQAKGLNFRDLNSFGDLFVEVPPILFFGDLHELSLPHSHGEFSDCFGGVLVEPDAHPAERIENIVEDPFGIRPFVIEPSFGEPFVIWVFVNVFVGIPDHPAPDFLGFVQVQHFDQFVLELIHPIVVSPDLHWFPISR